MTIDQAKLDEWKALAEAATPGPWIDCVKAVKVGTDTLIADTYWKWPDRPYKEAEANAAFIAAAREAIPALIGEVERLTRERDAAPAPESASGLLWCCHVRGPDDVYAAESYDAALKHADALNDAIKKLYERDPHPDNPWISAVPALWPWSAEAHAEDLRKNLPAAPASEQEGGE